MSPNLILMLGTGIDYNYEKRFSSTVLISEYFIRNVSHG